MNIVTFTILNLGLFVAFILIWLVYRSRRVPLPGALIRIGKWADQVRSHPAEEKTATFGDLVLFVTLWIIAVTLWVAFTQGSEEKYKEELANAREQLRTAEVTVAEQAKSLQELREQLPYPVPLEPAADEEIIGDHVDLRWDAGQINSPVEYVVELTRVSSFGAPGSNYPVGKPCMFRATEPETGSSRFPADRQIESGTYVWRVGRGSLLGPRSQNDPCPFDDRIKEWSAYEKFTIYRTQAERLAATGEVLVGTSFVQNTPFSRADTDGSPSGFDIDLIRTVVAGCMRREVVAISGTQQAGLSYANDRCTATAQKLAEGEPIPQGAGDEKLRAHIVVLGPGVDWRDKMQRRNLDAYIGALTRAAERETGNIHFSQGYLAYESKLFLNNLALDDTTVAAFARGPNPTIGAVENSTNYWLAEELSRQYPTIKIQPFISFAQLETQFETKILPAIIVDGVMARSFGISAHETKDLTQSQAWSRYLNRIGCRSRLGIKPRNCAEKFGIAVADDIAQTDVQPEQPGPGRGQDQDPRIYPEQLRDALNQALSADAGHEIIDVLYHRWNLGEYHARRCHYPSDLCWEPPARNRDNVR